MVVTYARNYVILMIGLVVTITACTPPTPPPSPTPWPTGTSLPTETVVENTPVALATATATPRPRPTATPPLTTIVVWENLPEAQVQTLAEDIEAFQTEYPHYAIDLQHYDSPENFMTPLLAHELNFDVVLASPVLLGSLWAGEQIAPMSDFFPPSFIDGFASITLDGAVRDEELWGIPDTTGFHLLLFYNRDMIDTPPTNTEALFDLAQTLMTGASRWGLGLNSYDPLWLVPWLATNDGWLTDELGHPDLNTPAMKAALELYLTWQDPSSGIAPRQTYEEMRAGFLQEDVPMMIDGEWAIAELARVHDLNWGVAPLPAVGDTSENQPATPLVLARYWAISRSTTGDQALTAAAFLEFITRPERQLVWTSRFGLLPTRRQAFDDPLIINDSTLRASANQMRAGRVVPLGTNTNTILNAMRDPLRAALDGELTPSEAVELMQTNAEQ